MRHMSIVRAEPAEAGCIADTIADAFQHLGVFVWLVPPRSERRRILRDHCQILVEHALSYGEVHVTDDRTAVAVWFARDGRPLPPPDDYDQRLSSACGRWTDRFQLVDRLLDAHRPWQPHHYLASLAVRPERQGEGLGSALLRHYHAQLDADGTPAYLEASSPPSRDLYARHGYRPGEPFAVPDGAPYWPMWREPTPL
ncbi:GNAT family N-acetyltransferase [Phytohabitans aurantiacus]|jgi:GNAT superfamily N-acetyltransferase